MSCIFCKIINGEIPCYKVYEDDNILAFLDITQTTIGHTLVIPKTHVENIFEWTSDISSQLSNVLPKVAHLLKSAFPNMKGLNMVSNNGEMAYQTVFHSHIHLIPRYTPEDAFSMTFNTDMATIEQLTKVFEQIKRVNLS